jgi:hypothetical protein
MRTVPLNGRAAAGRVALVDDEDYGLVSSYNWRIRFHPNGQAYADGIPKGAGTKVKRIYMHILIMGTKGVDHRDHDGLNNQRYNLRPATKKQNARNSRRHCDGSSRFKGVSWDKSRGRWRAQITVNGKMRMLGRFAGEADAARVYDAAAAEAFGEFACLNFPEVCG